MATSKDNPEENGRKGTVHRALDVLSVLADSAEPLSIRDTAQKLKLAPSTTHRLLNLLKTQGYATYIPSSRCYTSGPEFFRVANRIVSNVSPIRFASEAIKRIANEYHQTVLFGLYLPSEGAMSFAARADGDNRLMYRIEMNTPLSIVWGASGKAILAQLPAAEIASVLEAEGDSPASGRQKPKLAELNKTLQNIREEGYCISNSEKLPGACGIAAPVFGAAGLVGSICLTSPRDLLPRTGLEKIGLSIANHAQELSKELGADVSHA